MSNERNIGIALKFQLCYHENSWITIFLSTKVVSSHTNIFVIYRKYKMAGCEKPKFLSRISSELRYKPSLTDSNQCCKYYSVYTRCGEKKISIFTQ